jgi:hypothetical protein
MPQIKLRPGCGLKMVYSNESMNDKNGLEVNHFEPAPPMHDVGGIL